MPDRLNPHEVLALREKLRRAGTFRLVTAFPFVVLLSGAVLFIGGYGLHWLLSPLLHANGPGIFTENPIASALATCALASALGLGGCLALVIFLDASPTTRGARLFLGSLLFLCVLLYAWSLRPHYRVHPDRLEIVSWRSSWSMPFAGVDDALITSSLSKYNRRSYHLRLMSGGRQIESLSITPPGLTAVLAQLPKDINCRTDREPENRPDLQRELGQAFAEGANERGLQLPPACLAALSL